MSSCNTPPIIHYIPLQLSLNGITLCFFTAYLYRLPTINSAKTIENYSGQVKSSWAKAGLLLTEFDEAVRKDIIKGVRRILPSKPDTRPAFLLPHYFLHPIFIKPRSSTQLLLKAATIWGFLGMFRFSTYDKLGIQNLVIVGNDAAEYEIKSLSKITFNFLKRRLWVSIFDFLISITPYHLPFSANWLMFRVFGRSSAL